MKDDSEAQAKTLRIVQCRRRTGLRQSTTELRAHLSELAKCGVTVKAISMLSGVGESTLRRIAKGNLEKILVSSAQAVLNILPSKINSHTQINAYSSRVRLEALFNDGYSQVQVIQQLTVDADVFRCDCSHIALDQALAIEELYQRWRLVDSYPTIRRLAELRNEGFSELRINDMASDLARRIGSPCPQLPPGARHPAWVNEFVQQLHNEMIA